MSQPQDGLQNALHRIERAKGSDASELDLSRLNLTAIPEPLTQLSNLEILETRHLLQQLIEDLDKERSSTEARMVDCIATSLMMGDCCGCVLST